MIRFMRTFALVFGIMVFALAGAGYAQNKPLKKVRVGVPSVSVANIIIYVT